MPRKIAIHEELANLIDSLHIIDSHEHLPMEKDRSPSADVLEEWLTHYFSCDLVSAGLSDQGLARARDSSKDLLERWQLVEPYWEAARTTGYGRSLDLAAAALYDIDGVSRKTIGPLNEAFVACSSTRTTPPSGARRSKRAKLSRTT